MRFVLGEHREADFAGADFVVRNPGVPRTHPCLQVADSHGVPIYMEMTLFFLECPSPRITGVSGTKGKTTTTTLIGEIVRAAGRDVVVAGNLRVSALEQLPRIGPQTEVVLELSSFQLEGLEAIRRSPATACITNLMADHLNRYPSLESYFEAKTHIFRYQDGSGTLVLNRDDPHSRALAGRAPGRVEWFGLADDTPGADDSRLRGEHNRANMAAAAAVARALGIAGATTGATIGAFRGVPYRQELVRERAGVQFVNDSAATTPDALMAALAAAERPVVLIAGGADKELDFTRLGRRRPGPRLAPQGRRAPRRLGHGQGAGCPRPPRRRALRRPQLRPLAGHGAGLRRGRGLALPGLRLVRHVRQRVRPRRPVQRPGAGPGGAGGPPAGPCWRPLAPGGRLAVRGLGQGRLLQLQELPDPAAGEVQ